MIDQWRETTYEGEVPPWAWYWRRSDTGEDGIIVRKGCKWHWTIMEMAIDNLKGIVDEIDGEEGK